MKRLIVYYSYTGNSEAIAKTLAKKEESETMELLDRKKPAKISAYTIGCFRALRMKPSKIQPIEKDLTLFDEITIVVPIWAGKPAPPFNSFIEFLPPGKNIKLILVSGSGNSNAKEKITKAIENKKCKLISYKDIKG